MVTSVVLTALLVAMQLLPEAVCDVDPELGTAVAVSSEYEKERNDLIHDDQHLMTGSQKQLGVSERRVDAHLKQLKRSEFDAGLANLSNYAPSMHFFAARPLIEQSAVFRMLRRMPKGAMLHGHTTALVSAAWIVQNLTYRTDVLRCETADRQLRLTFRQLRQHRCVRVVDDRAAAPSAHEYDAQLQQRLTLIVEQPQLVYPDTFVVWKAFGKLFKIVKDLSTYEHTFRLWYWRLMQELHDDRLMYAEVRTGFSLVCMPGSVWWNNGN